jgi:hypothetical protein
MKGPQATRPILYTIDLRCHRLSRGRDGGGEDPPVRSKGVTIAHMRGSVSRRRIYRTSSYISKHLYGRRSMVSCQ